MSDAKCTLEITGTQINNVFVKDIIKKSGSNVRLCYQCHKCTAGCPIASFTMDDNPSTIIHSIRLGLKDKVLASNSIWICASCKACTSRCPQKIDVAKVMDEARKLAMKEGHIPKEKDICEFYNIMYQNICILGRMYEPGLIGFLKLKTGHYTKDLGLGWKMFWRGKLIPWHIPIGGNTGELKRIISRAEEQEEK